MLPRARCAGFTKVASEIGGAGGVASLVSAAPAVAEQQHGRGCTKEQTRRQWLGSRSGACCAWLCVCQLLCIVSNEVILICIGVRDQQT